ncbi:MAG: SDR family oxidoreductase, partial [Actinobacteria bacterium]|nr:SDR family oxidoreductase [Actinomycetota bacterium]
PEEVAEAVALLASARLSYVTGHAFVIDGGWTASLGMASAAAGLATNKDGPGSVGPQE